MKVNGQIHVPAALFPVKEPLYQLDRRVAGAPKAVWTWWGK